MLTKDLLKYRCVKGIIHPHFVDPDHRASLEFASSFLGTVRNSNGQSVKEWEEVLQESELVLNPLFPAFKKLLTDRILLKEVDKKILSSRWEFFLTSQKIREEHLKPSVEVFQESFANFFRKPFAELAKELYRDLPQNLQIEGFEEITPEALVNLYNCSQIQGLLLRAQSFQVTLSGLTLAEKRRFFQLLKFYQLLVEVKSDGQEAKAHLIVEISGPLAIFEKNQTYGIRMANFFPYILQFPKWELKALIKLNQKDYHLEFSDRLGLQSTYKESQKYIPDELSEFVENFNAMDENPWKADHSGEFLHLGQQSYCFPDFCFSQEDTHEKAYLELFHPWHQSPLKHRLQAMEKLGDSSVNHPKGVKLYLGVSRSLGKKEPMKKMLEDSQVFKKFGIFFNDFPSSKALLKMLAGQ